ncbi:MAG: hypothetical protein AB7U98_00140 [Candidatus Nitrosocosmicus sp.]
MSYSITCSRIVTYAIPLLLVTSLFSNDYVFAHNFAPNESAQFLSLIRLLETEASLVGQNLVNNNTQLAQDHAKAAITALSPAVLSEITERNERIATDLKTSLDNLYEFASSSENNTVNSAELESKIEEVKAILGETISARIDPDQINNATIQALSFANLIDRILKSYGDAYAVGFDLTDMSQMGRMGMNMNMNMDNNSSDMGMNMNMMASTSDTYNELVNVTGYQTAQALSEQGIEIFKSELKPLVEGEDRINMAVNLENALIELNNSIENKASPMDIMMIVHTKVHPNILSIFNLPLVTPPS